METAGSSSAAPVGSVVPTKSASGGSAASSRPSRSERLLSRYALQGAARKLLPEHRVSSCMRTLAPGATAVDVLFDAEHAAAHYRGLMRCGSAWVCPVCAAVITERRREELAGALAAHPELRVVMLTVTLQHGRLDGLAELMAALKGGMRFARSGRGWMAMKDRLQIAGSITSSEVTWGAANGWHPHEHILVLCEGVVSEQIAGELERFIAERFGAWLERNGRYSSPEFGVRVQIGDAAAASYISKWGSESTWGPVEELVKSGSKQVRSADGLSPFGLLALAADGDAHAGVLFREYADAVHGRKLLTYTRGLRARLGMDPEKPDEVLAEEALEPAVVLASLSVGQWRRVLANDCRGELLVVASAGDAAALWAWLSRLWDDG